MQHSIAARYAARPAASFVRPSARARERRLGLRITGSFHPNTSRATVLRGPDAGPLVALRARWREIRTPRPERPGGRLRPVVTMRWTRPAVARADRPSGAAPAPWRG